MSSCGNEDQEQRETPRIEDSDVMTIEFLRARLLSERAVSKSARQRADELAKRVSELEEQLKFVSLQRKKAEKATVEILAILENSGITDVSEEYYSHSDEDEAAHDFNSSNGSVMNRDESSSKRVVINEPETRSGSEAESSPLTGRSLSWKSGKNPCYSLEKKKYMESVRRRASFGSSCGSSAQRTGKSCRRIKRRSVEELQNDAEISSKDASNGSNTGHDASVESLGYGNKSIPLENGNNENEREDNMESALQRQAQLIRRYEEEEKAQREWEEKHRGNNGGTQDSYDPGNHSDVTEERFEAHSPKVSSPAVTSKSDEGEIDRDPSEARGIEKPDGKKGKLVDPRHGNAIAGEFSASEFSFPPSEERTEQDRTRKQLREYGNENRCQPCLPVNAVHHPSSNASTGYEGERKTSRRNPSIVPQEASNDLGMVLDALQRAKLSLNQQMNGSTVAVDKKRAENERFELPPIASPGLFRLPNDYQLLETSRTNRLGSSIMQSAPPEIPGIRFFSTPPFESRNGNHSQLVQAVNPIAYRPFEENPSFPTSPMNQPAYSANGMNYLNSYTSPVHPSVRESYPFLPDITLRAPLNNKATSLRSLQVSDSGLPQVSTRMPLFDDHIRPNIYR